MLLVYLSAAKTTDNRSILRTEIIHNANKHSLTQLSPERDVKNAKLISLEKALKSIPWRKESVTVFLNDDQLYKEYTSHSFKNEHWPSVLSCQDSFALVISFRNKGVLSEFLEEKLEKDISKSPYFLGESMLY